MKRYVVTLFVLGLFLALALPSVASASKWQWPTDGEIISVPGMRHQPVTGVWRRHNGIDIQNVKGTKVFAARSGRVVAINRRARHSASNEGGGYGNYVVIRHKKHLYSIYAHLSKVKVKVGQRVRKGKLIGRMGNTGLTRTVHLHFGIGPSMWVNRHTKNPLRLLPSEFF